MKRKGRTLFIVASVIWASVLYVVMMCNEGKDRISSLAVPADYLSLMFPTEPLPSSCSPARAIVESHVISFHADKVDVFLERNHHSFGDEAVLWVPGVDGFHEPVLHQWARLVGEEPINATMFEHDNEEHKDIHQSPHAVGCYLAHWHLLRGLQYRPPELRPELFLVFEDDASCIPNLVNRTIEVTRQLPSDWDMFFLGGKPYTDFIQGLQRNFSDATESTLRRDICRGAFGKGDGPLAPNGSRTLSSNDPYWRIFCMLNTHAYVVNPRRVDHVLKVLKPEKTVPIDQRLASAMERNDLNVYIPPQNWCRGDIALKKMEEPVEWSGYFYFNLEHGTHPGAQTEHVWQDKLKLHNCSY